MTYADIANLAKQWEGLNFGQQAAEMEKVGISYNQLAAARANPTSTATFTPYVEQPLSITFSENGVRNDAGYLSQLAMLNEANNVMSGQNNTLQQYDASLNPTSYQDRYDNNTTANPYEQTMTTAKYGSHLVDGQQIIPQQSGYNAQAAQAVQQTQQPSWMGQWQAMQDQFNQMMQGWQTQQQAQQQPSYGYNGSNTKYNYQPVYSNPLMRPVTANSNIAPQQAPSNMGYQNRTSLWGDV